MERKIARGRGGEVFRFSLRFLPLIARDGEIVKKIRSLYEYPKMEERICSQKKGRAPLSRVTEGAEFVKNMHHASPLRSHTGARGAFWTRLTLARRRLAAAAIVKKKKKK